MVVDELDELDELGAAAGAAAGAGAGVFDELSGLLSELLLSLEDDDSEAGSLLLPA